MCKVGFGGRDVNARPALARAGWDGRRMQVALDWGSAWEESRAETSAGAAGPGQNRELGKMEMCHFSEEKGIFRKIMKSVRNRPLSPSSLEPTLRGVAWPRALQRPRPYRNGPSWAPPPSLLVPLQRRKSGHRKTMS